MLTPSARGDFKTNLAKSFSLEDLDLLCYDLGVNPELLPLRDRGVLVRAQQILLYFERRNQLSLLIDKCIHERPDVEWRSLLIDSIAAQTTAEMGDLHSALCPYPGLQPFTEDQSPFFFGRETEITVLTRRVLTEKSLFVIGPSGSGKSSLILAGLIPALRLQGGWFIRSMRPGAAPDRELTRLLGLTHPSSESNYHKVIQDLLSTQPAATKLLIVIDQFEELFTLVGKVDQLPFLMALAALSTIDQCVLIMVMRADFYGSLMDSDLWSIAQYQRLEVVPLRGDELRKIITQPAIRAQTVIEEKLVDALIHDAAEQEGSLPLIQETLRLLWHQKSNGQILWQAYQEFGKRGPNGLLIALESRANAVFGSLSARQQRVARQILMDLVQLGEGRPDVRRQRKVVDLQMVSGDLSDFNIVLEKLAKNRIVILDQDKDQVAVVDLAHDSLVGGWPLFRRWLDEDRQRLRLHRYITQCASEWQSHKKDEGALLLGMRLREAREYAANPIQLLSEQEQEYLDACERFEAKRQRARYLGQAAGGALGTGVGYILFFAVPFIYKGWIVEVTVTDLVLRATLLVLLSTVALGCLIGFSMGLALWRCKDRVAWRPLTTGLVGAAVGGFAYLMYLYVSRPGSTDSWINFSGLDALIGALPGFGMGVGLGLFDRTSHRLIGVPGLTLAAVAIAAALSTDQRFSEDPLIISTAGLLLGCGTVVGFQLTNVRKEESG